MHDSMTVAQGSAAISELLRRPNLVSPMVKVLVIGVLSFCICISAFDGTLIDSVRRQYAGPADLVGCRARLWPHRRHARRSGGGQESDVRADLRVRSRRWSTADARRISAASLLSFVARGLSTTHLFCYESLVSSGLVALLPGFLVFIGALELAGRSLVVRSTIVSPR